MSVPIRPRDTSLSRYLTATGLALVLPPLSVWFTQRTPSLHAIPFALDFVAIATVAAMGNFWPSLLALFVAVADRIGFLFIDPGQSAPQHYDLTRFCVLLAAAFVVSFTAGRRHRFERKLKAANLELQERTDSLIDSLRSGKCASWIIDLESGKSARWFPGSYEVFGRPFAEIEALPSALELLHPEDRPSLVALTEHMRDSSEPVGYEYRAPWPDGQIHWFEMRATRIPGEGCVWRGITVDITERKLTEAALLRAEKLAAMGRLASTVAHEINNPLEAVTNLLYLARADDSMRPVTQQYLSTAERELSRLSNITRLTLGFVRTSGSVVDTSVSSIVDEVLSIFQHRFETRHAAIECDYSPGVCISIAPHELRQIATNLIANAADALAPTGGRIRISTSTVEGHAVLCVEDNGSGISAVNLSHIFEPFFSTKEEVGTGIGLWVTRELTEKNGGSISVESGDLPHGLRTRFRVEFPLTPDRVS